MRQVMICLSLVGLLPACTTAGVDLALELAPDSGPLRYCVNSLEVNTTETPVGTREQRINTVATVVLEFGRRNAEGLQVSAVFEKLVIEVEGLEPIEGGELLGRTIAGVAGSDGTILLADVPDLPASLRPLFDPNRFLAGLLPPLPSSASVDQSWPASRESVTAGEMTVRVRFEGAARVVGDTVLNGTRSRVIAFEGEGSLSGHGTPSGAPSEIELTATGPFAGTYVWDPARRIMLASEWEDESNGTVSMVGSDMAMPYQHTLTTAIEFQALSAVPNEIDPCWR